MSIAFIKKALFFDVIPKFTVVKGQFINETNSLTPSHKLMKSHLTKHIHLEMVSHRAINDIIQTTLEGNAIFFSVC